MIVEQTVPVIASLESRPAALFVQAASKFSSQIVVKIDGRAVNAKSIMGIISLGILDGQEVTISAEGDDAGEAVSELKKFLTSRNQGG